MRRLAFTITEMLVSVAVILLMMAIISEAFVAGLESFRDMKAVGDLDGRLRSASILLRKDLESDHFGEGKPLSEITLPPLQGFFRIFQGSPPIVEGVDADGIPSTRATDSCLHFTIKLSGARLVNYLSTPLPAGSPLLSNSPPALQDGQNYLAQWGEVAYFLRPTGQTTPNGTPLFSLHRRQRLLYIQAPGLPDLNSTGQQLQSLLKQDLLGVSSQPDLNLLNLLHLNTPTDVTAPVNRFGMKPPSLLGLLQPEDAGLPVGGRYPALIDEATNPSLWGADLVLTDVVSFEVKIFNDGKFVDLFDLALQPLFKNPAFQGAGKPRAFDTWTNLKLGLLDYSALWNLPNTLRSMPLDLNIRGLEITIRVWDPKTNRTRQVTLVQEM